MTSLFLQWLYIDAPQTYWQYRKQLVTALLSFFSVSLLAKSLFDPWRHDQVDVSRMPVRLQFQAWTNNLISRFIGFTLRSWVIGIGLFSAGAVTVGTAFFVVAWYLLPLLLLLSMGYGFSLLFGGLV